MTDLNDVFVTANLTRILAAQYNKIASSAMRGDMSNSQTLSADATLTDLDFGFQVFDCNGVNRIVTLPAPGSTNHPFFVYNATVATYALTVKSFAGTTLLVISPGLGGIFISDSTAYRSLFPAPVTGHDPVTLAAFGSTPSASGASLSAQELTLQPTDSTHPGGVSTVAQNFHGIKTFDDGLVLTRAGVQIRDDNTSGGVGDLGFIQLVPGKGIVTVSFVSQGALTVPDSGFENATLSTNWPTVAGSPVRSTAQHRSGAASLLLDNLNDAVHSNLIANAANGVLLDFWIYGTSGKITVTIECFTSANAVLGVAVKPTIIQATAAEWTRFVIPFTLKRGTKKMKIKFALTTAGAVYVDDVSAYKGSGSQIGAA